MTKQTITPAQAREQGYTIDDTCYPWVAYKGPRFAPDDFQWCFTELEARMAETLSKLNLTLEGGVK